MDSNVLSWAIPLGLVIAFLVFKRLTRVSRQAAHQLVSDGAKLVDVRSAQEFATGHIPGAINVPVQEVLTKVRQLGPKDSALVVYCASGARSAAARAMLKGAGFTKVFNLGSMSRW